MFDFNNKKMEEEMVEVKARDMFAKLISKAILESESAPEHVKLVVGILDKVRDIYDAIHKVEEKYCTPQNEANTETLKRVKEYLELVDVGINQFVETTPFVKHTEE